MLFKKLSENKSVKWIGYTSFYLLILLLLFFIYGFHTANTDHSFTTIFNWRLNYETITHDS